MFRPSYAVALSLWVSKATLQASAEFVAFRMWPLFVHTTKHKSPVNLISTCRWTISSRWLLLGSFIFHLIFCNFTVIWRGVDFCLFNQLGVHCVFWKWGFISSRILQSSEPPSLQMILLPCSLSSGIEIVALPQFYFLTPCFVFLPLSHFLASWFSALNLG